MKGIYVCLFFAILSFRATSQILIGPEAGGNLSWTRFDDPDLRSQYKVRPIIGYNAGLHFGFRVQKRYFLHMSVLYSTKGRKISEKAPDFTNHAADLSGRLRLNYIDVPIIYAVDFKGKLGGNKEFKYSFGGGPIVSYWLGGAGYVSTFEIRENLNGGVVNYHVAFTDKVPDGNQMTVQSASRMQFGLNVAASLSFEPAPARRVMLTLRYELGHSYLSKQNGSFAPASYQEPLQSRNKGFRLSVAYLFDLKTDQRKKGKTVSDKKKAAVHIRKKR